MRRFLLKLQGIDARGYIDYNYQEALRAYIYNKIGAGDAGIAELLHEGNYKLDTKIHYKLFTFSFLDFKQGTFQTVKNGIRLNNTQALLTVSFYQKDVADAFLSGIEKDPILTIHKAEFDVVDLKEIEEPNFTTTSHCLLTTPIFIQKRVGEKQFFLSPNDVGASKKVEVALFAKAKVIGLDVDIKDIKFVPSKRKARSKLLKVKDIFIRAYFVDFTLHAPIEVQKLSYFGGIGSYTSTGLGCYSIN